MNAQAELEARINQAWERGDRATVVSLQERYRSSGFITERVCSEPIRVVEARSAPRPAPAPPTPRPAATIRRKGRFTRHSHPSQIPIILAGEVWRFLRSEVEVGNGGLEFGGACYGRFVDGEGLRLEQVIHANAEYGRASTRMMFDIPKIEEMRDHFAAAGWEWVADWHTHPGFEHTRASDVDCEAWAARARVNGARVWGGLILTPGGELGDRWLHPWVSGYVVEKRADGHSVVSPARLIVED